MKSIKFIGLLIVLTLVFSFGVSAKEMSSHDSVEKLLLLMKQDRLLNQTFDQIKPMLLQQFQQTKISSEQSQIMDKYMDKIFDVMKEEMSWDKIKEDYIQIYMSVYTEAEIQELITFYQSPIGQKMIDNMPMLMQKSMVISQKCLKNILPKIQALSLEMATEIKNSAKNNQQ
jgi:uncharacterized protein